MIQLEERNQKIIDAVIQKANIVCPGALDMIGIYGSFQTGDIHPKSDLDLLIVIHDDSGWQLGSGFIQDDLQVGHDIYCTSWESLENDAKYEQPNISKLMDAKIVYCAEEKYQERLDALRHKVTEQLAAPFVAKDYEKAEQHLREAEHFYTNAMISDRKSEVLKGAGGVIYCVENAIAMLNKRYFKLGVKRAYEELNAMPHRPEKLCEMIESVVSATSVDAVKENLTMLIKEVAATFEQMRESVFEKKKPACEETLAGTYEELFSNWRNKMYLAAESEDKHLAFMSMVSAHEMLSEIYDEVAISSYDMLAGYDAQDLNRTAQAYDHVLEEYLEEYKKADMTVKRYADIDAFVRDYSGI